MTDLLDPRGPGLLARALAALVLGTLAVVAPAQTLALFVPLFATFALVDGGAALAGSDARWWSLSLVGAVGLAACLFCFLLPGGGAVGVVTAFGAWSAAVGVLEIIASAQLRRVIRDEFFLTIGGLFGVGMGLVAIFSPVTRAAALLPWIAATLICTGTIRLMVALRVARATATESSLADLPVVPA